MSQQYDVCECVHLCIYLIFTLLTLVININ